MLIEDIQKICKTFPKSTEDIKWETHLCYCIGEKMFIITSPDDTPVSASFKVDEEEFVLLSEREGFRPAPYVARYKWIYVDDINRLTKNEWADYLKRAYVLVKEKLPRKTKIKLGLL